jgi:hypothetical protein
LEAKNSASEKRQATQSLKINDAIQPTKQTAFHVSIFAIACRRPFVGFAQAMVAKIHLFSDD